MSVMEYKCPNCGGSISFDSQTQKMVCPFCEAEFDVEALRQLDEALKAENKEEMNWEGYEAGSGDWQAGELDGIVSHLCPSCGGEIVGDQNTAATTCPYCGNPAVMTQKLSGMLRPDDVIPFKYDKESAKTALKGFLKGKTLLPSLFHDQNQIDSITGIYVPFWLFDCDTHADIRYHAEKVRKWSDNKYNYTERKHYKVYRSGDLGFVKIPVDGSQKMDDTYMEAIEPYNYNDLTSFQTAYLAGYLADKYDVDAESGKPRVNERIRKSIDKAFLETVTGFNSVREENTAAKIKDGKVRYALLPVWMLNTKYKDQMYTFAMNGQTGKFIGKLPVSWPKFWGWLFGLGAGLGAIAVGISNLLDFNSSFGAVVASLVITGFVMGGMYKKMNTARPQSLAHNYIKEGSFQLTRKDDVYLYKRVEKKEKPKS